jgi:lambda family phage portal protein
MSMLKQIARMFGFERVRERRIVIRGYGMATQTRLDNDWLAESTTEDRTLKSDLRVMRDRARVLARDDDYAKRFLGLCRANIAGPNGIKFNSKVVNAAGKPDARARAIIEEEFRAWCEPEFFSACGQFSRSQWEQLASEGMPRDGEFLARIVPGFDNPWGISIQCLEPEQLDHTLNVPQVKENGNRIVMGVEKNRWGRPVAYWLHDSNPNDDWTWSVSSKHTRWPEDQIIHLFVPTTTTQSRGATWFHTAGGRLHHLRKFEDAELVASRAAASKMGFLESVPDKDGNYPTEEDEDGKREIEIAPGIVEELPNGKKFVGWDPDHPNTTFGEFQKAVLRGAAAGLLVSYNALANDLEGVNYSSIRAGVLEDREMWKILQNWVSYRASRKAFRQWLKMSILTGRVKYPMSQFERLAASAFDGRRWQWVDPLKDIQAAAEAVKLRVKSRRRIVQETDGDDFADVMAEFKQDEAEAEAAGVELDVEENPEPQKTVADSENETDKGEDDEV